MDRPKGIRDTHVGELTLQVGGLVGDPGVSWDSRVQSFTAPVPALGVWGQHSVWPNWGKLG